MSYSKTYELHSKGDTKAVEKLYSFTMKQRTIFEADCAFQRLTVGGRTISFLSGEKIVFSKVAGHIITNIIAKDVYEEGVDKIAKEVTIETFMGQVDVSKPTSLYSSTEEVEFAARFFAEASNVDGSTTYKTKLPDPNDVTEKEKEGAYEGTETYIDWRGTPDVNGDIDVVSYCGPAGRYGSDAYVYGGYNEQYMMDRIIPTTNIIYINGYVYSYGSCIGAGIQKDRDGVRWLILARPNSVRQKNCVQAHYTDSYDYDYDPETMFESYFIAIPLRHSKERLLESFTDPITVSGVWSEENPDGYKILGRMELWGAEAGYDATNIYSNASGRGTYHIGIPMGFFFFNHTGTKAVGRLSTTRMFREVLIDLDSATPLTVRWIDGSYTGDGNIKRIANPSAAVRSNYIDEYIEDSSDPACTKNCFLNRSSALGNANFAQAMGFDYDDADKLVGLYVMAGESKYSFKSSWDKDGDATINYTSEEKATTTVKIFFLVEDSGNPIVAFEDVETITTIDGDIANSTYAYEVKHGIDESAIIHPSPWEYYGTGFGNDGYIRNTRNSYCRLASYSGFTQAGFGGVVWADIRGKVVIIQYGQSDTTADDINKTGRYGYIVSVNGVSTFQKILSYTYRGIPTDGNYTTCSDSAAPIITDYRILIPSQYDRYENLPMSKCWGQHVDPECSYFCEWVGKDLYWYHSPHVTVPRAFCWVGGDIVIGNAVSTASLAAFCDTNSGDPGFLPWRYNETHTNKRFSTGMLPEGLGAHLAETRGFDADRKYYQCVSLISLSQYKKTEQIITLEE